MADRPSSRAGTDAPELQMADDIARRSVPVALVLVAVSGLVWGVGGVLSTGVAVVLVVVNLVAAAALIAWGSRRSAAALMGAVLGGYVVRLGLLTGALWVVGDLAWVERTPLFATVLITHVVLIVWEARRVSMSLAFPGLKPKETAQP